MELLSYSDARKHLKLKIHIDVLFVSDETCNQLLNDDDIELE